MANLPFTIEVQLQTDDPGSAACEAVKVLGILVGFGCLPLLRARFPEHFWIAGLAAGVLVLIAGLFHGARLRRALTVGLSYAARRLAARLMRRAPAGSPLLLAATVSSLAVQTLLIGVFLLVPALLSFALRRQSRFDAGLLQIYLGTPAILVWIAGDVVSALPLFNVRPKHAEEVSGLLHSGLQVLGALLLWIYLGLSVGTANVSWMFWSAVLLTAAGLVLGLEQTPASAAGPTSGAGESEQSMPAAAGNPR